MFKPGVYRLIRELYPNNLLKPRGNEGSRDEKLSEGPANTAALAPLTNNTAIEEAAGNVWDKLYHDVNPQIAPELSQHTNFRSFPITREAMLSDSVTSIPQS
jgi:hypothetical protein